MAPFKVGSVDSGSWTPGTPLGYDHFRSAAATIEKNRFESNLAVTHVIQSKFTEKPSHTHREPLRSSYELYEPPRWQMTINITRPKSWTSGRVNATLETCRQVCSTDSDSQFQTKYSVTAANRKYFSRAALDVSDVVFLWIQPVEAGPVNAISFQDDGHCIA